MPSLEELGLDMDESELGQERAVLEAIYPEMNFISAEEMEIRVEIEEDDLPQEDDEEGNDENDQILEDEEPYITLRFILPPTYPASTPPKILIPSSSPSKVLDSDSILSYLNPIATDTHTPDTPQIFDLIDTAREHSLALLKSARMAFRNAKAEVVAEKDEAARQEHDAKFGGTKVTKDRFMEWWGQFSEKVKMEESMRKVQIEEEREESGRLTGRQLWERGLAGGVDVDETAAA